MKLLFEEFEVPKSAPKRLYAIEPPRGKTDSKGFSIPCHVSPRHVKVCHYKGGAAGGAPLRTQGWAKMNCEPTANRPQTDREPTANRPRTTTDDH